MTPTARETLHQAAALMPPPVDGFERAVRRGRRLRRQAVAARVAVPIVVVAFVAGLIVGPRDGSQSVKVVDDPRTTTMEPPAPDDDDDSYGDVPAPSTSPRAGVDDPVARPSVPTVPPAADPPRRLVTTTTTFVPAPAGARVAYAGAKGHLYTMRPDGTDRRLLSSTSATPLAWSPDRRSLLVTSGGRMLDALDVDTGSRRTIVEVEDGSVLAADFSPDGRRIVYWARDGDTVHVDSRPWDHIWVADADGTDARELPVNGQHPSWSPDGTRILLSACTGATQSSYVCTVRPDGTGVSGLETPMFQWPRWSPDGRWIAGVYGNSRLAVVRPDGSGLRDLVHHSRTGRLAWTTDGEHIVYHHDGGGLARVAVGSGADMRLSEDWSHTNPVVPWR